MATSTSTGSSDDLVAALIGAIIPKSTKQTVTKGPITQTVGASTKTTRGNLDQDQLQGLIEQSISPLTSELGGGGVNLSNSSALQLGSRQIAGNIIAQNAGSTVTDSGQTTKIDGTTETTTKEESTLGEGTNDIVRLLLSGLVVKTAFGAGKSVLGDVDTSKILDSIIKGGKSIFDLFNDDDSVDTDTGGGQNDDSDTDTGDELERLIRRFT
ncbi:MAG: hypothetical protein ORO03_08510, partial [Alphaproteobacteria bacterium]|nr:hypothetical protein [Alphaproteobacteria bacterium]